MSAERRQLPYALLLSLLIHALLLSLTFGGQGWLPGFGFFWQDRRIEATDLSVVLVPAQITAAEPGARSSVNGPMQASIGQPVAGESAPTPPASPAPTLRRKAEAIVPKAKRTPRAKPKPQPKPAPDTATGVSP